MTDPLGAAQQAITETGSTMTLGTATGGHLCHNCGHATLEVAPLMRLGPHGPSVAAWFMHCPYCEQAQLNGSEGE